MQNARNSLEAGSGNNSLETTEGGHSSELWAADSEISTLSIGDETYNRKARFSSSFKRDAASSSSNSILPRSSLKARLSDRQKDLNVCKLRIDESPLFGREDQIQLLTRAFEQVVGISEMGDGGTTECARCKHTTATDPPTTNVPSTEHKSTASTNTAATSTATDTTSRLTRSRGLVLVKGVSGTGKTSLIQDKSLRQLVRINRGIFTLGKCELQQVDEPYASAQDAMSLLCYEILQLPRQRAGKKEKRGSDISHSGSWSSSSGSDIIKTKVTLEDIQSKLTSEFDETEWRLLIEAVPGLEKIMENNPYGVSAGNNTKKESDGGKGGIDGHSTHHSSDNDSSKTAASLDGSSFKDKSEQLKFVYRHFIRAVSSLCPLVLVLDDCQWADKASLEWIKYLITDTSSSVSITTKTSGASAAAAAAAHDTFDSAGSGDNGSLLIVASFRTEEVDEDHDFFKMIKDLRSLALLREEGDDHPLGTAVASPTNTKGLPYSSFLMQEIEVGNLSVEDINGMLVDLLTSQPKETLELAQVLHQKTMGNAFFVTQFLLRLKDDHVLSYSLGLMKWMWDLQAVRYEYNSTDNVADLMQEKMQRSAVALCILPVAACLGSTFSPVVLRKILDGLRVRGKEFTSIAANAVTEQSPPPAKVPDISNEPSSLNVEHTLVQCCSEGFLEAAPQGLYRFVHDKIQEAALEFLDGDLKISIGDIFLEQFFQEKGQLEDTIYSAVSLVNLQIDRLPGNDKKLIGIAEMNALAGKKALQCAAFGPALRYLSIAKLLLPDDHWATNRDLSLSIYTLGGAAEFCAGNRDQVKVYTDKVLEQVDVPLLDKMDLCHTLMDAYEVGLDSAANLEFGLKVLKGFKCRFPKSGVGITFKTVSSLLKAKLQLKKQLSAQALETKPIVTDNQTMALMKTLDKLSNAAFHAKPELLPLVILEMAKYTDRFGLNPYAAVSYPVLGLLFAGVLEDFETAKLCGEAGVAIMKRCNYPIINSRCTMIAYFYALHWTTPIKSCMKPLLEGYEMGMKMGTLDGAFWCIAFFLEFSFWTGEHLSLLHADYTTYIQQAEEYDAQKPLAVMKFTRHMATRLLGLADESIEDDYDAFCKENGEEPLECTLRRTQMYVACILGEHEKTAELSLEWQAKVLKLLPGQVNTLEVTFVSALSCMAVLRKNPKAKKSKKYLKMAKMCRKKIKSWVSKSCPNCVAHEALLEAESLALKKDKGMALRSYESAVLLAGRRGLTHVQALASERFAIYLDEVGETEDSEYRFNQASKLYAHWGATAKVEQMESKLETIEKSKELSSGAS